MAAVMPTPRTSMGGGVPATGDAVLDPSNNLVASHGDSAGTVQATSPQGTVLWTKTIPGVSGGMTVDGAGNFYITGHSGDGSFAIWKLNPAGEVQWTCKDSPVSAGHGEFIVLDESGGVYAAGHATGTSADLFLLKCNAAGAFQWSRRFSGSAGLEDKAAGLVAMPGGGVVVTGITRNAGEQFVTLRYSAAGAGQWISYYDFANATEGVPCGIVRTADGALAVAGMSGDQTVATVKYSASGAELWANRTNLSTTTPTATGAACNILPGPDGGAVVLNFITSGSNVIARLLAVGGDGVTDWHTDVNTVPSGPNTYMKTGATALAALRDGSGYVVASGVSDVAPGIGSFGRIHSVDQAGGSVTQEASWGEPSFDAPRSCSNILTGTDGSVWAPTRDSMFRWGAVQLPGPPGLGDVTYDSLQSTSVRFKGKVAPNGYLTQYHYEFGPTISYGSNTPVRDIPAGWLAVDAFEPGVTLTAGTTYHYRLVATNTAGTVQSGDQTFTTPQSAFQIWTVNAFGSLNAPGAGPQDDSDKDSLANLVEYAFGGDPKAAGMLSGLPVSTMWESQESGFTFPAMVYRPDATRTDVTLTAEASNDLQTWTTNGISITNLPDGSRRAVAQGFQHFMRVRVSVP